jgi:hypothetical protein
VLDVPANALGTFTINFFGEPDTLMTDQNNLPITPLNLVPARITIACQTNTDCNDNNACTNDICNPNGSCSNLNNYDPVQFCCRPSDRLLAPISDSNECTTDACNPTTGAVTHTNVPNLTPCGNPNNTECDRFDTCMNGVCEANIQPAGTPCGDPTGTDCNAPDSCNGSGICLPNFAPTGTPCGDPSDTDCTNPDTCNGAGQCLVNHAPNGTACNDSLCCTVGERCAEGICGGGAARDCEDGKFCTTDVCDEGAAPDCCVSTLDPGFCLIGGLCFAEGSLNPGNDCQACNTTLSTTDWSFLAAGTLCDDGDSCTGTGRPGIGFDECDGAGGCVGIVDPDCNDQCEFAVPATEGANPSNNDNRGPDDAEASCQPDSNNDVWFKYVTPCDTTIFASTTGSQMAPSNDPVLSVWSDCPSRGGSEIVCDDDSGLDLQAALSFAVINGTTYYFRVAGFEDNSGDLVLNISTVDDCLIDGICYADGAVNPANECEVCNASVSTNTWTPRAEGTACGDALDTECSSPDACNGLGSCERNHKPDGTACSDDGNQCTFDECAGGSCAHPPRPAGTPCGSAGDTECDNPDTCDGASFCQPNYEADGVPCGDPSSDQCDNPDSCDGGGSCDPRYKSTGTACDDGDVCTGSDICDQGLCGGAPIATAPLVTAFQPRYVLVTPQPAGGVPPIALRMTSPDYPCLDRYINASGLLVSSPVFRTPDQWGTVLVRGANIIPDTRYQVVAECGAFTSPPGQAKTSRWGDVVGPLVGGQWSNPDGSVDITIDVTAILEAFRNGPLAPAVYRVDLVGVGQTGIDCRPDGRIDIIDVTVDLDAFRGLSYTKTTGCPTPCVLEEEDTGATASAGPR